MGSSAQVSVATIDSFLNHVGAGMNKSAAAPLSEAGSIGGETSHPVKNVDDRLQKAKEGERSKENEADVKADQGPPSVENAGSNKTASLNLLGQLAKRAGEIANPPGTADEDQLQIGTNKQPTGEDPANETNKAKAGKDDPGSSHPARTDNDSLDGHKYAYDASTPIEKMAADLKAVGEDLCASLEVYTRDAVKTAGAQPPGQQPQRQPVKTAGARLSPQLAQQAGWEIAGIVNGTMDKTAADRMVHAELTAIIKEACDDASNVAEFMNARRRKQAEDAAADDASGASGAGPGPGADGGGAGPVPSPESAGGGEGMGGMGGGDMGGGGAGAPPTPQAVDAVCQELGWDKEDLLNALLADPAGGGGMGGGGSGSMPDPSMGAGGSADAAGLGGGGASPPGMPPMPPGGGMEAQAAAGRRKQPANIKTAGFEGLRAEIRNYLQEVRNRSQR